MSERGVYAIDRGIWDDPDFADEPFTEREAWMWLIGAAAWKEVRLRVGPAAVTLQRAEFCYSVRFLAEKFSWSKSRVARFLEKLKKRDTIRDTSRDKVQVYFIKNYNDFQVVALPQRDTGTPVNVGQQRDSDGTAAGQQRDKEETLQTLETLEQKKGESAPQAAAPPAKPKSDRGTRWPKDAVVPSDWFIDAEARCVKDGLPIPDLRKEAGKFERHWSSTAGAKGVKLDWHGTWINWAVRAGEDEQKRGLGRSERQGRKQTALDSFIAGGASLIAERGGMEASVFDGGDHDDPGEAGDALLPPRLHSRTG